MTPSGENAASRDPRGHFGEFVTHLFGEVEIGLEARVFVLFETTARLGLPTAKVTHRGSQTKAVVPLETAANIQPQQDGLLDLRTILRTGTRSDG